MTNDPFRDDAHGLGGPPSGQPAPPSPPDADWRPPPDLTVPDPPEFGGRATGPDPAGNGPAVFGPTTFGSAPTPPTAPAGPEHAPRYDTYPAPQAQAQPYPTPPYPGPRPPTNGLAVAALVCSLAGVVTGISAPIGAVLGHLALRQIAQTGEEGASMAKAAIWVGWIITGLAVAACCAVLAIAIAASRSGAALVPR